MVLSSYGAIYHSQSSNNFNCASLGHCTCPAMARRSRSSEPRSSSDLNIVVKCKTEGCNFRVTWLRHVGQVGEDYCCRKCKDGDGHGGNCDKVLVATRLPPPQFLPGAQPLRLLFEWDAASNESRRRKWRPYTDDLQRILKIGYNVWKCEGDAGRECCFQIGDDEYKVDWSILRQIKVGSNYTRKIRIVVDE